MPRRCVLLALALGCGRTGTEPLDPPVLGGGDTGVSPDTGVPTTEIACGLEVCGEGEVCATYTDQPARCFRRGDEPSFENGAPFPWPAVLLYCDGDEDCSNGMRCVLNPGEIFRADCLEEGESCPIHVGHVCTSDADCHSCPNPGDPDRPTSCEPINLAGATHLSACRWR